MTELGNTKEKKAMKSQLQNREPALEASTAAWYNTSSRKDGGTMDTTNNAAWETLTPEEKRRALYDRQVVLLATFLEHGAISKEQHDKSLHDLTVKMGYEKIFSKKL